MELLTLAIKDVDYLNFKTVGVQVRLVEPLNVMLKCKQQDIKKSADALYQACHACREKRVR